MAYSRINWKDRIIQRPNTFEIKNNPDGTVTLIPKPGTITEAGTPVSAANLNKIEDGILAVESQLADIAIYPEQFWINGFTNWTPVFTAIMNKLAETKGGTVILGGSKIYEGDITISSENIIIKGGRLKGNIIINTPVVGNNLKDISYEINGVQFLKGTTDFGIKLIQARVGRIMNCKFDSAISRAIAYDDTPTFGQPVNRTTISDNEFNGDYALHINPSNTTYAVGDFNLINNKCVNKLLNLYLKGVDGFVCIGNTMFMPGYQLKDTAKMQNIYIENVNWININGNHLFEAGLESILMSKVQNPMVCGNHIAWCGQRVASSAIRIKDGDTSGNINVLGVVSGNNIMFPTLHGISVEGNSGGMKIDNNNVKFAGYAGYYYGSENLSTMSHYGINTEATTRNISVTDNHTPDNLNNIQGSSNYYDNNYDMDRNVIKKYRILTVNTAVTTFSVKGVEGVNIALPVAGTITSITDGYEGQEITIYAFNGNATISNSVAYLRDNLPTTIPINRTITIRYNTGKWFEITRSY